MPKGAWSWPTWAGATRAPSFAWLLDFFLFPMIVVEDVSGVVNASDAVLCVNAHRSRLGGLCPLLQDKVVHVPRLSMLVCCCRSTSACCSMFLSTKLQRFQYITFASGSSGLGIDRSIMAVVAKFYLGLMKYFAPSLLSAT